MIDLASIRDEVRSIDTIPDTGHFVSVSDWSSATDAMEHGCGGFLPQAFVVLADEKADANRLATGRAQRITSTVSILFVIASDRADGERTDAIEVTRGSIIQRMVGFVPGGAVSGLSYAGYALRAEGDGEVWGEVRFAGTWDLRKG